MKILKNNFFNYKESKIKTLVNHDVEFIGTIFLNSTYMPWAIYKVNSKYFCVQTYNNLFFQMWLTKKEIKKYSEHYGVHCKKCDTIVYSVSRHDYVKCKCGSCAIDGGKDYIKFTKNGFSNLVLLDLIEGKVIKNV